MTYYQTNTTVAPAGTPAGTTAGAAAAAAGAAAAAAGAAAAVAAAAAAVTGAGVAVKASATAVALCEIAVPTAVVTAFLAVVLIVAKLDSRARPGTRNRRGSRPLVTMTTPLLLITPADTADVIWGTVPESPLGYAWVERILSLVCGLD